MRVRIIVFVCLAFTTAGAFAANLGKYNDWSKSPTAYFMTKADRAEWSKLQSEADAEQFVKKFVDVRGGAAFESEVAAAVKAADDHLSMNGALGSRTLRGRIVIVLGPPSSFSMSQKQTKDRSLTPAGAVSGSSGTSGGGRYGQGAGSSAVSLDASAVVDAANASDMSTRTVQVYTFTYSKDRLAANPSKDMIINVEVNPSTGDDRISDTRMARQVNELLDAAAEARATAKAAK